MLKINLKEKEKVMKDFLERNRRKIIFTVLWLIIFLVIASILLLIWWPTKASFAEITSSWVALIMVCLFIILFLFEKPIYQFYQEVMDLIESRRYQDQQSKQKELFHPISNSNFDFGELVSYRKAEEEDILKRKNQEPSSTVLAEGEIREYLQRLQEENIKWRFLFADIYLVFNAKYILFWFFKVKSVKQEEFNEVWQAKIPDEGERAAILNALLSLDFIRQEGDALSLTDLGSAYINYLKKLDEHPGE